MIASVINVAWMVEYRIYEGPGTPGITPVVNCHGRLYVNAETCDAATEAAGCLLSETVASAIKHKRLMSGSTFGISRVLPVTR